MTEQKPHKWQKEIVAWAGGAKVEERFWPILNTYDEWEICTGTPPWDDSTRQFRLHDPYREFREAQERGEKLECRVGEIWDGRGRRMFFTLPPDCYRIAKPEPKGRVVFCKVKSVFENHPYVSRYANVTIDDYGNVIKIDIV